MPCLVKNISKSSYHNAATRLRPYRPFRMRIIYPSSLNRSGISILRSKLRFEFRNTDGISPCRLCHPNLWASANRIRPVSMPGRCVYLLVVHRALNLSKNSSARSFFLKIHLHFMDFRPSGSCLLGRTYMAPFFLNV